MLYIVRLLLETNKQADNNNSAEKKRKKKIKRREIVNWLKTVCHKKEVISYKQVLCTVHRFVISINMP